MLTAQELTAIRSILLSDRLSLRGNEITAIGQLVQRINAEIAAPEKEPNDDSPRPAE